MIHPDPSRSAYIARRRKRIRNRRYASPKHKLTRMALAPFVAAGLANCVRCHELIEPGTPWDLGHDDRDPSKHSGPEHAVCNRGAPGRNKTSRQW